MWVPGCLAADLAQPQAGNGRTGVGDDRVEHVVEVPGAGERVVVESLDAEEAVGGEADLPRLPARFRTARHADQVGTRISPQTRPG